MSNLPIKNETSSNEQLYQVWDKNNPAAKQRAIATSTGHASKFDPILRTSAYSTFENVLPGISVRDSYSRRDYTDHRQNEKIPRRQKEIIRECMEAYRRMGIVKNIIDLMADFTYQGITPAHIVPATDRFIKAWWKKIKGTERSERFVNLLLRAGNVVVHRRTAKITPSKLDQLKRIQAAPDEINPENPANMQLQKMEIPWQYTFLNPLDVDVVGEEVATFVGVAQYTLNIPNTILKSLTADNNNISYLNRMPQDLVKLIKSGAKSIPLPDEKIIVCHYKKDDWSLWADPIHFCILEDLIDYQKARLADRTALDAAASRIRIWRLGSLEHELLPTQAAFVKLNNLLMALGAGGTIDIMWGPDLQVEEISSDMNKYFGPEKYQQTLSNIYAGLGIPSTLTGDGGKGFTNNYVSLRTLTERLDYARMILTEFWTNELAILQQAIGVARPFMLTYERVSMTDDAAEKAILVQLADRDIISHEAIMAKFDLVPELENSRLKREHKKRMAGKIPEKASPFHKTGQLDRFKELALQRGLIRPEDVDVESSLDTKKILMQQAAPKPAPGGGIKAPKSKGQPQQGRPKNSNDTSKRKQKRVTPKSKAKALASIFAWAKDAQLTISEALTPVYLHSLGKKNLRQLSNEESNSFEELKFAVLANAEPFTKLSDDVLQNLLDKNLEIQPKTRQIYADTLINFMAKVNQDPTIEDVRNIQLVSIIANLQSEEDENG